MGADPARQVAQSRLRGDLRLAMAEAHRAASAAAAGQWTQDGGELGPQGEGCVRFVARRLLERAEGKETTKGKDVPGSLMGRQAFESYVKASRLGAYLARAFAALQVRGGLAHEDNVTVFVARHLLRAVDAAEARRKERSEAAAAAGQGRRGDLGKPWAVHDDDDDGDDARGHELEAEETPEEDVAQQPVGRRFYGLAQGDGTEGGASGDGALDLDAAATASRAMATGFCWLSLG